MSRIRGLRESVAGGISALTVDLLAFGGSATIAVVTILLETIELWIPLLSYLTTVGESVVWIPEGAVESILLAAMTILIGIYLVRIVRRGRNTIADQSNDN